MPKFDHRALRGQNAIHRVITTAQLQRCRDKTVAINFQGGEVATVKIASVDTESDRVIVEIKDTNRLGQYNAPPDSPYRIRIVDILSVEEIAN
jgi:hypothetical protein